ncbi:uncharacterized protein LOC123319478 [Coccinella septempunctata]|uniref:uncharacterized protein LOC123319478 n=1 Tax=Coccinella septempunctata TaxID=41139 RepID=UPI001D07488F|nr:uncharacterized protein LOC123319478 [Coccinella septempunctata]
MLKYSTYSFHPTMSKSIKHNHNIQSFSSINKTNCFLDSEGCLGDKRKSVGTLSEKDYSPPFYKPKFDPQREVISPPFFKSKLGSKSISQVNNDFDTESIISGVSEIKLIKSLSSSPSWSDDNDVEGCRRVQDELEQMDRVLRGLDPIPLHYDVDEYKQWMETFPTLSFFGHKEYGPYKIWKGNRKNERDVEDVNSNRVPCANLIQYKKEIKKAVIQNIYENISIRLNNGSTPPEIKKKQPQIGDINKTQMYLSDCLKNSPFSDIIGEKYTKTCFLSRNNSREDKKIQSPSFESLPVMLEGSTRNIAKPVNKSKNEHLNGVSRKKSRRSIVLPPIENKWLQPTNQFRSISAMPTYSSMLSVKTMKMDSKLLSGKSRNVTRF